MTLRYLFRRSNSDKATNYSLWIASKNHIPLYQKSLLRCLDGQWISISFGKTEAFAKHINQIFTPNLVEPLNANEADIDFI